MSVGARVCEGGFRHASMCLRAELTQMEETIFEREEMGETPHGQISAGGGAVVVLHLFSFSSAAL